MRLASIARTVHAGAWLGLFCVCSPAVADAPATAERLGLPAATPESQGFSSSGLEALSAQMHDLVDTGKLAGVVTVLSRHGKVVHFDSYGKADARTGQPIEPDSIFRIASMTKPITGVAMMQLYEQGKWRLDDPVAKHIPAFADLRVKKPGGGTEPQRAPMTMAQLMSHSAGFGVSASYSDADLYATDLQGMIDKLQALPLETQPGTAWDYGPSVNIQGYIVEKLSGQSLDEYFQQHIFEPLGMVDTGFRVPADKAGRVVAIHTYENGRIVGPPENTVRTDKPSFLSGSGGLVSTAEDYWRFSQALVNGGALDGKRILEPETVKLMYTNVLPEGVMVDLYGSGLPGLGFGMDFAIVLDPAAAETPQGVDSYYWGGAFGTWFWIDPTHDLVFVGMIQNVNGTVPGGGTPDVRGSSIEATYAAMTAQGAEGEAGGLHAALAAADRPEADRARDAGRKPADVVAFLGFEEGMTLMDVIAAGGYYTEVLSVVVGDDGTVYAQNPPAVLEFRDGAYGKELTRRLSGDRLPNVVRLDRDLVDSGVEPESLDGAITALNFHDVYNRDPEAAVSLLRTIKSLLKPGGVLGITDHVGDAGADNASLHRVEKEKVIEAAKQAGFEIAGDSNLLRNPDDDHSEMVFAPGVRGSTDRFLLKLVKPG